MADEIHLRPVNESDVLILSPLHGLPDRASFNWFSWGAPGALAESVAKRETITSNNGILTIAEGEKTVGSVTWSQHAYGEVGPAWEIGITVSPESRGKGVGTQAQRLLVEYLFATTTANRVQAMTDVENFGEQRSLEKAGFAREGVLRGAQFRNGEYHDLVVYGVLRADLAER